MPSFRYFVNLQIRINLVQYPAWWSWMQLWSVEEWLKWIDKALILKLKVPAVEIEIKRLGSWVYPTGKFPALLKKTIYHRKFGSYTKYWENSFKSFCLSCRNFFFKKKKFIFINLGWSQSYKYTSCKLRFFATLQFFIYFPLHRLHSINMFLCNVI